MNAEGNATMRGVRRLYKYSPYSTNLLAALTTGALWYPKASSFNDPFDCTVIDFQRRFELGRERAIRRALRRPTSPPTATKSERELTSALQIIHDRFISHRSAQDDATSGILAEIGTALQDNLHDFGILCLTENPRSILMWSHYAANHTGVCLEFERARGSKLAEDAKPVRYVTNRYSGKDPDLFFDKHDGWSYEKEWRLLENKGDSLYPFPGPLRSIICGARMRDSDASVIRQLVQTPDFRRKHQVAVKAAHMHHDKYRLFLRASEA